MTAANDRTAGRLNVPLTQNTAPVFEFNCLYSQDVRRKHKRWNDGFLKYHTFNKRVLVYDIPRNLIGDMHWLGEEDLQEGDELKLEKGGALVQVADKVGQTETDLTELRNSRNRRPDHASPSSPSHSYPKLNLSATAVGSRHGLPLKNKSLNALLGTPRGPIGKAVLPIKSPYEIRSENAGEEPWCEGRPAKRPRTADASSQTSENQFLRERLASSKHSPSQRKSLALAGLPKTRAFPNPLRQNTIIDLCDEEPESIVPGCSSKNLELPSSPLKQIANDLLNDGTASSPFFQTQKQPRKELKTRQAYESNAPQLRKQTRNTVVENIRQQRKAGLDFEDSIFTEPTFDQSRERHRNRSNKHQDGQTPGSPIASKNKPGKILRLAATAPKKKMLLCQEQVKVRQLTPNDDRSSSADSAKKRKDDGTATTRVLGETLSQRLSRIDKKRGSTSRHSLDTPKPAHFVPNDDIVSRKEENTTYHHDDLNPDEDLQLSQDDEEFPEDLPSGSGKRNVSSPPVSQIIHISSPPLSPLDGDENFWSEEPPPDPPSHREIQPEQLNSTPPHDTLQDAMRDSKQAEPMDLDERSPEPELPLLKNAVIPGFQRASSINTEAAGGVSKPFKPPQMSVRPPKSEILPGSGAWSREAFDLFTWRPQNWDEEKWCVKG